MLLGLRECFENVYQAAEVTADPSWNEAVDGSLAVRLPFKEGCCH